MAPVAVLMFTREPFVAKAIGRTLVRASIGFDYREDERAFHEERAKNRHTILVLEEFLPCTRGSALSATLRQKRERRPIVLVDDRLEEDARIECGADAIVVKQPSAVLRAIEALARSVDPTRKPPIAKCRARYRHALDGDLVSIIDGRIDPQCFPSLSQLEERALRYLIERAPQWVSHDVLRDVVWKNLHLSSRSSLPNLLERLIRKIGERWFILERGRLRAVVVREEFLASDFVHHISRKPSIP